MDGMAGANLLPPMRDVTSQFLSACQGLQFGEMVKIPDLGMMEAMNALVMLDPRMDSGCSSSNDEDNEKAEEELSGLDLSPGVVCEIMDRLMRLEMTYHTGAPLVQTLFTSRYLLQLHPLTSSLLQAQPGTDNNLLHHVVIPYMHALRLCMYLVWNELTRGHVYDGEDFMSDTAGLWESGKEWSVPRLHERGRGGNGMRAGGAGVGMGEEEGMNILGYDECDLMLEDVVERIDAGLDWLDTAGYLEEQVKQLKARIGFRKNLLSHLIVVLAASYETMPIPYPTTPLSRSYHALEPFLARPTLLSEEEQAMVDRTFDTTVYARFRQIMPLPKIEILEGKRFTDRLGDLVRDMDLCERLARDGDLDEWERELIALSVGERPTLPFVRSCLVSNLTPTPITLVTGLALPRSAIRDHFLKQAGIGLDELEQIGEVIAMDDPAAGRDFERWQKLLSGHWLGYLLNLLHNRSRTRRSLLSSIENWDDLREQLPRSPAFRQADLDSLEKALERQRLFMGLLGMLGGLDNELWPPGPVGRGEDGKLGAGGEPEQLAMVFWWIKNIAERYLEIAEPGEPTKADDWKTLWMSSWCHIANGMFMALSSIEQREPKSSVYAAPLAGKSRTLRPRTKDVFDVRFKHFTGAGPSLLGRERLTASWSQWRTAWTSLKTNPNKFPDLIFFHRAMTTLESLGDTLHDGFFRTLCVTICDRLETLSELDRTAVGAPHITMPSLDQLEKGGLPFSLMWMPLVSTATEARLSD